ILSSTHCSTGAPLSVMSGFGVSCTRRGTPTLLPSTHAQRRSMSILGVVREGPGERRVAVSPTTVSKILGLGYDVVVEAGAGAASSFPDSAYAEAGARIVDRAEA